MSYYTNKRIINPLNPCVILRQSNHSKIQNTQIVWKFLTRGARPVWKHLRVRERARNMTFVSGNMKYLKRGFIKWLRTKTKMNSYMNHRGLTNLKTKTSMTNSFCKYNFTKLSVGYPKLAWWIDHNLGFVFINKSQPSAYGLRPIWFLLSRPSSF